MEASLVEPDPPDPQWPRYSSWAFPPYRFVQGRAPHPKRHPHGHSYGKVEPLPEAFPPEQWRDSEWYLYGVDLYNYAYWWECHEVFESLWHAVGEKTEQGRFFQALIQIAAANIKRWSGVPHAAASLQNSGLEKLRTMPPEYMGMNVARLVEDVEHYFQGRRSEPALIRLNVYSGQTFPPAGKDR